MATPPIFRINKFVGSGISRDSVASGAEWLDHQFQIEQIAPNFLHDLFAVGRLNLGQWLVVDRSLVVDVKWKGALRNPAHPSHNHALR